MMRARRDERGSVSVLMAVLGVAILAAVGLVVDGGRQLGALTEARNIADNAARAGSLQVDIEEWRRTGRPVIDRDQAAAAVAGFMSDAGYPDYDIPASIGPDADITVTVTVRIQTASFFFPSRTVQVTQSANAIDSVVGP